MTPSIEQIIEKSEIIPKNKKTLERTISKNGWKKICSPAEIPANLSSEKSNNNSMVDIAQKLNHLKFREVPNSTYDYHRKKYGEYLNRSKKPLFLDEF